MNTVITRPSRCTAVLVRGLAKTYGEPNEDGAVRALRGVDLDVVAGSYVAVMGPSGSGKSTLLQCASGIDRPDSGEVLIGDIDLVGLNETAAAELRRSRVGFVFQSYNLLPTLTVRGNVELPLRLCGARVGRQDVERALDAVGLTGMADRLPATLSGGQRQRVAIARSLLTEPEVLFADEPTGALDSSSARAVLGLLREAVERHGRTVVMVTHDPVAAATADRVVFMANGRVVDGMERPTADAVAARMTHFDAIGD